jgi:non-ribosomal peptide synthetase component E (peptide arylation enzyme)
MNESNAHLTSPEELSVRPMGHCCHIMQMSFFLCEIPYNGNFTMLSPGHIRSKFLVAMSIGEVDDLSKPI